MATTETKTLRDRALEMLQGRPFVLARDLYAAGVTAATLTRLERDGLVEKAGRGVWREAMHLSMHGDLVATVARTPNAIVAFTSAARIHRLVTLVNAPRVTVLLPSGSRKPTGGLLPVEAFLRAPEFYACEIEAAEVEGHTLAITSPTRTVVDLWIERGHFGEFVVLEALETALGRGVDPEELVRVARELGAGDFEQVIRREAAK